MERTRTRLNLDLLEILRQCLQANHVSRDLLDKLIEHLNGKPETDFEEADRQALHMLRIAHIPNALMAYRASPGCSVIDVGDDTAPPLSAGCGTTATMNTWAVTHPTDESLVYHLELLRNEQPSE